MTLSTDTSTKPRIVHPFRDLMLKSKNALIGTGLHALDRKVNGLSLGEYALLVGYSGGGKTALGVNMVGKLAETGMPTAYISCEEAEDMLAQRFYAHSFNIRYGNLRDGESNFELEAKFAESQLNASKIEKLRDNLCLFGLKGIDTITPEFLYSVLVQHYEKTGFVPTLIMLDQMQFITPDTALRKNTPPWELEKAVSVELDELSHRKVGDKNFVLWVQHQAKGKVRANFTRDEIDGFKGIIHKADLALGIGRAHSKSDQLHIFSLKTRHCQDFSAILKAELEYMRIHDLEVKETLPEVAKRTESDTMTQVALT